MTRNEYAPPMDGMSMKKKKTMKDHLGSIFNTYHRVCLKALLDNEAEQ
jgi:hypothetical protein